MPTTATPSDAVHPSPVNALDGLTGLVLHHAPTALRPNEQTVPLPDVALDPAWSFEAARAHLREHGHALRPNERTTIHLTHARTDLELAIRTLDVHDALRLMGLPGLRASDELLGIVLGQDLDQIQPVVPMDLGERMAAQETLVTLFLAGGARPVAKGWEHAAEHGNPRLLARLLQAHGAPLSQGHAYGLLLHAAKHNGWDSGTWVVNRLLANGAYLNPRSQSSAATPPKPPLCAACEAVNLLRVEDLLTQGADPDLPRPDGAPPLRSAFKADHPDLVMRLLRAGANLHALVPFKGRSVFEEAVLRGAPASLQRLLDEGIDPLEPTPGHDPGPGPYGTALLDRLLGLHHGRTVGASDPSQALNPAALESLILLEAHGLNRSMVAPVDAASPKRRL